MSIRRGPNRRQARRDAARMARARRNFALSHVMRDDLLEDRTLLAVTAFVQNSTLFVQGDNQTDNVNVSILSETVDSVTVQVLNDGNAVGGSPFQLPIFVFTPPPPGDMTLPEIDVTGGTGDFTLTEGSVNLSPTAPSRQMSIRRRQRFEHRRPFERLWAGGRLADQRSQQWFCRQYPVLRGAEHHRQQLWRRYSIRPGWLVVGCHHGGTGTTFIHKNFTSETLNLGSVITSGDLTIQTVGNPCVQAGCDHLQQG